MNGLALCAGVGGLELGISLALGDSYRTVCLVEREAHAAAILVARMEDGCLAPAPVWDDLTTFDGRPWRGLVDVLTAGYPCQPFSYAGQRGGTDDPRHLWPHVARVIAECGPAVVFLENVPGHLSLGLESVLGDLGRMGFVAACGLFSASEVGAPHRRERLFILAHRDGDKRRGRDGESRDDAPENGRTLADGEGRCSRGAGLGCSAPDDSGQMADTLRGEREPRPGRERVLNGSEEVADAVASGWGAAERHHHEPTGQHESDGRSVSVADASLRTVLSAASGGTDCAGRAPAATPSRTLGDPDLAGPQGRRGAERGGAYELPAWPPGPADERGWASVLAEWPDLAPALESRLRGVADGLAARVDRLRACGNGVVPLAAAYAFRTLAAELVTRAEFGREGRS